MNKVQASIDIGNNLTVLLEKLATQIGVTADKIFPWYVKQAIVEGWIFIVFWLIGTILSVVLLVISFKRVKFTNGDPNKWFAGCLTGGILAFIYLIALMASISFISGLINPEYAAMTRLIKQLSQLKP